MGLLEVYVTQQFVEIGQLVKQSRITAVTTETEATHFKFLTHVL